LSELNPEAREIIGSWAHGLGLVISPSRLRLLGMYLHELMAWNERMNLTGLSSIQGIITELLLDSLIPAPFLPRDGRLLDMGSGAGFPGIPLKICRPQLAVDLMEANLKKVSFLKQVVRLTGLTGIRVLRGRVEKDGAALHPQGYHVVTARAVAPLSRAMVWAGPHVMSRGLFMDFQGSGFEDSLRESRDVMKRHRIVLYKTIPYTLPGKDSPRHLLIFTKQA
jgi:16S rRNA (guanine527-N7)-methyltransferase